MQARKTKPPVTKRRRDLEIITRLRTELREKQVAGFTGSITVRIDMNRGGLARVMLTEEKKL